MATYVILGVQVRPQNPDPLRPDQLHTCLFTFRVDTGALRSKTPQLRAMSAEFFDPLRASTMIRGDRPLPDCLKRFVEIITAPQGGRGRRRRLGLYFVRGQQTLQQENCLAQSVWYIYTVINRGKLSNEMERGATVWL